MRALHRGPPAAEIWPPTRVCASRATGSEEVASSFPPAFVAFLRTNDIHPDNYAISDVPRFVRVSPRAPGTIDREELERQFGAPAEPVAWLAGYYRVPSHIKIAGCDAYRSGHLYGIDVSSGAAVTALDVRPGEHVLDLCCAPGAKLCALADAMGLSGTLTGVDVSEQRLAACRTLCTKYGISNVRGPRPAQANEHPSSQTPRGTLFHKAHSVPRLIDAQQVRLVLADGRHFGRPPPSRWDESNGESGDGAERGAPRDGGRRVEITGEGGEGGEDGRGDGDGVGDGDGGEGEEGCHHREGNGRDGGCTASEPGVKRSGGEGRGSERRLGKRQRRRAEPRATFYIGRDLRTEEEAEGSGRKVGSGGDSDAAACDAACDADGRVAAGARWYDKVLVDAECTHDGSIKHLAKFEQWGWETFERRFLDPTRLTELASLQAALLRSGFRVLRPGGALIYSTCSFARAQNEDIVAQLLHEQPRAKLLPIDTLVGAPCMPGSIEHTVRFEPRLSHTSGLFIARITKLEAVKQGQETK